MGRLTRHQGLRRIRLDLVVAYGQGLGLETAALPLFVFLAAVHRLSPGRQGNFRERAFS